MFFRLPGLRKPPERQVCKSRHHCESSDATSRLTFKPNKQGCSETRQRARERGSRGKKKQENAKPDILKKRHELAAVPHDSECLFDIDARSVACPCEEARGLAWMRLPRALVMFNRNSCALRRTYFGCDHFDFVRVLSVILCSASSHFVPFIVRANEHL